MWESLSIELQELITSHLTRKPSFHRIGIDPTCLVRGIDASTRSEEIIRLPYGISDFCSVNYVLVQGFGSRSKFACDFSDLRNVTSGTFGNEFTFKHSKTNNSFVMDFGFFEKSVKGKFTKHTFFSNPWLCAVSKRYTEHFFTTDCVIPMKTKVCYEEDYIDSPAIYLTVQPTASRSVEVILYCSDNLEQSPIYKTLLGYVRFGEFYCSAESLGELLWCPLVEDSPRWSEKWGLKLMLTEQGHIAANTVVDGEWSLIGGIVGNEIWIKMGRTCLWDEEFDENGENISFHCEVNGTAAKKWWRLVRNSIHLLLKRNY